MACPAASCASAASAHARGGGWRGHGARCDGESWGQDLALYCAYPTRSSSGAAARAARARSTTVSVPYDARRQRRDSRGRRPRCAAAGAPQWPVSSSAPPPARPRAATPRPHARALGGPSFARPRASSRAWRTAAHVRAQASQGARDGSRRSGRHGTGREARCGAGGTVRGGKHGAGREARCGAAGCEPEGGTSCCSRSASTTRSRSSTSSISSSEARAACLDRAACSWARSASHTPWASFAVCRSCRVRSCEPVRSRSLAASISSCAYLRGQQEKVG